MSSPYDHPDYQHLLAAVRAAPDDDLPRLVMADWLEERGEGERAVLIRKMCEKHTRHVEFGSRDVGGGMWTWDSLKRSMPTCFKWKTTSRRVAKLALEGLHTTEWRLMSVRLHRGFVSRVSGPLVSLIGEKCRHCDGGYFGYPRSGVPGCPVCDATGYSTPGVLRELVKRDPVRFVEVTDANDYLQNLGRPITYDGICSWSPRLRSQMMNPGELNMLFANHTLARAALSAAILRLVQPVEVPT